MVIHYVYPIQDHWGLAYRGGIHPGSLLIRYFPDSNARWIKICTFLHGFDYFNKKPKTIIHVCASSTLWQQFEPKNLIWISLPYQWLLDSLASNETISKEVLVNSRWINSMNSLVFAGFFHIPSGHDLYTVHLLVFSYIPSSFVLHMSTFLRYLKAHCTLHTMLTRFSTNWFLVQKYNFMEVKLLFFCISFSSDLAK